MSKLPDGTPFRSDLEDDQGREFDLTTEEGRKRYKKAVERMLRIEAHLPVEPLRPKEKKKP